jgi:hypothetical protein
VLIDGIGPPAVRANPFRLNPDPAVTLPDFFGAFELVWKLDKLCADHIISDLCDWGFYFLDSGLPIEQLPAALSERTEQVLLHTRRRWKLMLVTLMVTAGSGQRYMPRTRPGVTRFGAAPYPLRYGTSRILSFYRCRTSRRF